MAEEIFLDDEFLRQLMSVGEVDLLVAIPSYNHAAAIGQTVEAVEECLRQNFIRERAVILNADGGSRDGTREAFLQNAERRTTTHKGIVSLRTIHRIATQYAPSPTAGLALRNAVAAADLLRAKACAVVSPATTNMTPVWVANLLRPVYREQFDFVAPLYSRSRFSGLLARELLYPMSRAVFGQRVREVYADEWGFSGRLASRCLEQEVWNEEAVRTRPEAWMAITAMCSEFRCCQNFLGPKVAPSGPVPDIVEAVRQTVGNLFWCMEVNQGQWANRNGSQAVPTFGPEHELSEDGTPANPGHIFELFRSGVNQLEPILATILSADTSAQIKAIALLDAERFRFSVELWVKALYEFAGSYHHGVLNRDHLVQALVPLYRGRLYSFLMEYGSASPDAMEADAERLSREFERLKPYLVERWNAKK